MQIKIKKIEGGKLPEYKTDGSAGADCYARIDKEIIIAPGQNETIPLGFAVEIPMGYEMQIRGRSGLARKNNIDCFTGTIDSDYRGEVCAILINKGIDYFTIRPFDRIAQAIIAPVIKATWDLTKELSETERGAGGFGSTGVSELNVNYPHKIDKFYEPFTVKDFDNLYFYLGRKVEIDNDYEAILTNFDVTNNILSFEFKITGSLKNKIALKNVFLKITKMLPSQAFERVKIDGHRFGREIEFEEKID